MENMWLEGYMENMWLEGYMENMWLEGYMQNMWLEGYMENMWLEGYTKSVQNSKGIYDVSINFPKVSGGAKSHPGGKDPPPKCSIQGFI